LSHTFCGFNCAHFDREKEFGIGLTRQFKLENCLNTVNADLRKYLTVSDLDAWFECVSASVDDKAINKETRVRDRTIKKSAVREAKEVRALS